MNADFYSSTLILNAAAVLLYLLMFMNLRIRIRRHGSSEPGADKCITMVYAIGILFAVVDTVVFFLERGPAAGNERAIIFYRSLTYLVFQANYILMPAYLFCYLNPSKGVTEGVSDLRSFFLRIFKNKIQVMLYFIPVVAGMVILIVNVLNGIHLYGTMYDLMILLTFFYVVFSLVMLFRINRIYVIIPILLIISGYYLSVAFIQVSMIPIIMALGVLYVTSVLNSRTLVMQLGLVIVPVLFMVTLFIGNYLTVSAFSSFITTISDRNTKNLNKVIGKMEEYESLYWLMGFWESNPEVIHELSDGDEAALLDALGFRRLTSITEEEMRVAEPEVQALFARVCYTRLASIYESEYADYNLGELDLIMIEPDESAHIILSGVRASDGSYRLGDDYDIESERQDWMHYIEVTEFGRNQWLWGTFKGDDDIGFYEPLQVPGVEKNSIRLCTSIDNTELYEHMDVIASFRIVSLIVLITVGLIIVFFISYMIIAPLSRIRKSLEQYSRDKDADSVSYSLSKIKVKNEIGDFAGEFSGLAKEMERYTEQVADLAAEKERSLGELQMAARIQVSALPSPDGAFDDRSDFALYASMKTAKKVGGDFYDFFLIDDNRLAFIIADVSDKGIPAALFMMSAKNLINYRAMEGGRPGEIMTSVNKQLSRKNDACMFVTAWLGILQLDSGRLIYCNAGHEPPAIAHADGSYELTDNKSNVPMGFFRGHIYKDQEMDMLPGDNIFLYTDGITEATDTDGNFFGRDRLIEALDTLKGQKPADVIKGISDNISVFSQGAEQYDDMTMLCLTYSP